MSPVTRHHRGAVQIDPTLLDDIDWVLDMDTAAAPEVVRPLGDELRDYHRDLSLDYDRDHVEGIHDWLYVREVDSVQRLRASLTPGGAVDAQFLSEVRNILDGLTLSFESECGADPCCNDCKWCWFLLLRDRCDAAFNRAGFSRPAYLDALDYDPDEVWRTRGAAATPAGGA
ncbi:hypothetical protein [Dactylosporangium sp. CA-139066]|uniref:hypothetical protein n=1 Tax=Dactylosporangium sp. CA-139066 TaxID=3239930 RepID=UPI003D8E4578